MISVQIGGGPIMNLRDVSEGWIAQQVDRRQGDARHVCVRVTIETASLHMLLATSACAGVQYSGKHPLPQEQRVLDLWVARGMNKDDIAAGNLVAFLHQLERVL